MIDPYENIIVGNFLYGLGLAMGMQPRRVAGCINLLQQTPQDRPLGDVMVHYPGALRLIEFKRTKGNWGKEQSKYHSLSAALSARPYLNKVSREVHWLVESGSDISARPYLDLNVAGGGQFSIAAFAAAVVRDGLGQQAFETSVLNEYLGAVATFAGVKDLAAGALLVTVDGSGTLRYVAVENFLDLRMTAEQLLERSMHAHHAQEQQQLQSLWRTTQRQVAIEPPQEERQRGLSRQPSITNRT